MGKNLKEILEKRKAIQSDFEKRKADLTEDELKDIKEKLEELDKEERKLKALEDLAKSFKSEDLEKNENVEKRSKNDTEYRNFGEFMRNAYEKRAAVVSNNTSTDAKGKILVPEKWVREIFSFDASNFELPALTQKIESDADAKNQKIVLPVLDQDDNTFGGITIEEYDDTGSIINESEVKFDSVILEPTMKAGRLVVSKKLFENSRYSSFIQPKFRQAMMGYLEKQIVSGDNGYKNADALITVDRDTDDIITYEDITSMYASCRGENKVWVVGQSHLKQLLSITDPAGRLIFTANVGGISEKVPGSILGIPVIFSVYESTLSLVSLNNLYHTTLDALELEFSEHERFSRAQIVIRAIFYSDVVPALKYIIKLEDEVGEVSPFVTLSEAAAE